MFRCFRNHELYAICDQDDRTRCRRQVHFLTRDCEGRVFTREEYISDDKPQRCRLQIPPMQSARPVEPSDSSIGECLFE